MGYRARISVSTSDGKFIYRELARCSSGFQPASPPSGCGAGEILNGLGEAFGDAWRNGGLGRIMAQHFFHRGKFTGGRLRGFDFGMLRLLLCMVFGFVFHV